MKKKFLAGIIALSAFVGSLTACSEPPATTEVQSVALAQNKFVMLVGEEETLRTAEGEALAGSFLSTSPDFVSVDETGKIKALSVGSSVVIARTAQGTAVCTVVVTGEPPIDITNLTITGKMERLTAGDSVKLDYNKVPLNADNYNAIRWHSENAEVATVDGEGNLSALKPGRATIVLTATGTNFTDSFELEVTARPSRLSLNYQDATGLVGASDLTLLPDLFTDYTDIGAGAWSSDDASVAKVSADGKVSFLKEGKTTLRYSVTVHGERLEAVCKVAALNMPEYTVIRTPEQLQAIENKSGYYMLGNDIDLAEACANGGSLYHNGAGFVPLFSDAKSAFSGVFDGMGYSIKNLYMNSNNAFTALFSYVSVVSGKEGIIRNLSLDGGSITGGQYTAALVGRCNTTDGSASSAIENCIVRVNVSSFGMAAGFVGFNGSVIKNCISLCQVTGSTTAAFTLKQCDNGGVGVENCVAIEGGAQNLVVEEQGNGAFVRQATALSESAMLLQSAWQSWNSEIWVIEEGRIPALRTPNER